jgi:hypothetical protein
MKVLIVILIALMLNGCNKGELQGALAQESTLPAGEIIPRSSFEKAKYYLISVEKDGQYYKTIHSRISSKSTGYSASRIDCINQKYQDLGYGDNQSTITMYKKVNWAVLIPGSSKSDLVNYVCKKKA